MITDHVIYGKAPAGQHWRTITITVNGSYQSRTFLESDNAGKEDRFKLTWKLTPDGKREVAFCQDKDAVAEMKKEIVAKTGLSSSELKFFVKEIVAGNE